MDELNQMLDASKSARLDTEIPVHPKTLYTPKIGSRELAGRYKGTLDHLRSFYKSLTSVHLEAGVWLNFQERAGEGTFEYWLAGQKYRSRSTADPRLGLASGLVAAYDGNRYQFLFEEDSRLSLYRQRPKQTPAPFMNPFYLPVVFLSSEGDDCQACELNLEAIGDEKRWRSRVGEARGFPEKGDERSLILPGGRLEGQPFYFRLTLLPKRDLVSRIEYVRPGGKVFRVMEFSRFDRAPGATYPFPHHIVVKALDKDGDLLLSLHFMIKSLEVNVPIKAERFTIPFSDAGTVIDEDRATFLKHRQLKKDPDQP